MTTTRWVSKGKSAGRLRGGACLVVLGVAVALCQSSCGSKFDGPYTCLPGYASCTSTNGCETSITSDAANCGSCGHACGVGAFCQSSQCSAAPAVLATSQVVTQGDFASNGSFLVWATSPSNQGQGQPATIEAVPVTGGAPSSLASCSGSNQGSPGVAVCDEAQGLAIDATSAYFGAIVNTSESGSPTEGIFKETINGGTIASATLLIPASALATQGGQNLGAVPWMAVNSASIALYVIASGGGNQGSFWTAPLSNPTPVQLGPTMSGSGVTAVLGASAVYYIACNNGPCSPPTSLPLGGGPSTTFTPPGNGGDIQVMAVDASYLYGVNSSYCCSCGGPQASTTVYKWPLSGGSPAVVATTSLTGDNATGAAVDASNLYWVTAASAWQASLATGAVTQLAGVLGGPSAATSQCNNNSNNGGQNNTINSIAVDSANVYVADAFNGTIYRIEK